MRLWAKGTVFWTLLYVQHSGNTCCIRYLFNTYKTDEDKGTDLWKLAQRASNCVLHTIIGTASQMLGFFPTLPYLRKPCLLKQIADKWPSKDPSGFWKGGWLPSRNLWWIFYLGHVESDLSVVSCSEASVDCHVCSWSAQEGARLLEGSLQHCWARVLSKLLQPVALLIFNFIKLQIVLIPLFSQLSHPS